jgi:hypothetical protein
MEEILQVIGGLLYQCHVLFTLENKKMLLNFSQNAKNKLKHEQQPRSENDATFQKNFSIKLIISLQKTKNKQI